MSLFLAADRLPAAARRALRGARAHDRPGRGAADDHLATAPTASRSRSRPAIVRVADALDMAKGRSRIPFESGRVSIHSLSAAAIEEVRIRSGTDGKVLIEIEMNNSAGLFQVDNLLRSKLRGSGLEDHIEVEATHRGRVPRSACCRRFRL